MKWILFVLLVMNIGLGGYQYWLTTNDISIEVVKTDAKFNSLKPSTDQLALLGSANIENDSNRQSSSVQCIRIQGLKEDESLVIVQSRLSALEVKSQKNITSQIIKTDFQVILGPFDSSEIARDRLDDLLARGIESYVIGSGKHKNSLSMGVFSNLQNAERRTEELKQNNISASISKNNHFNDVVVLQINAQSAQLIGDNTLQSMLNQFVGAEFVRYDCN